LSQCAERSLYLLFLAETPSVTGSEENFSPARDTRVVGAQYCQARRKGKTRMNLPPGADSSALADQH
jgi:hypothetical protein